jgi:tetratricopeptide (TPR) repeat protein
MRAIERNMLQIAIMETFSMRHTFLRDTAYAAAGLVGQLVSLSRQGWLRAVIVFAATFLGIYAAQAGLRALADQTEPWAQAFRREFRQTRPKDLTGVLWKALALDGLLLAFVYGARSRRRIVVEPFTDHTGGLREDTEGPCPTAGLASLLVGELARLRDLYQVVDHRKPLRTSIGETQAVGAAVRAEAVDELLQSAVSGESRISLGPIAVPVGALMAIAGRWLQGPRIVGSVHLQGDLLILEASLVGSERPLSWRVETLAARGSRWDLTGAVRELGCRIFTDLTLESGVRWRATLPFIQGLRCFRDSMDSRAGRRLKLLEAERELTAAYAADSSFDLAVYNLGVVYMELGQKPAASSAFARAASLNPRRWEAYYGLALARLPDVVAPGDPLPPHLVAEAIDLCTRVEQLADAALGRAQALNLRGVIRALAGQEGALEDGERAASIAWGLVCLERARGLSVERNSAVREVAFASLSNLAQYALQQGAAGGADGRVRCLRRALSLMRQAARLNDSSALLHSRLAGIHAHLGDYQQALAHCRIAAQISPEDAHLLADLAAVLARLGRTEESRACRARALRRPSSLRLETAELLALACDANGDTADRARVAAIPVFWRTLAAARRRGSEGERLVLGLLGALRAPDAWQLGACALTRGQIAFDQGDYASAEERFREAIERFGGAHDGEIVDHGIRALRARALRFMQQQGLAGSRPALQEALDEVQSAILLDPLSAYERRELGEILFAAGDYEGAREAWLAALKCSGDDPDTFANLGQCYMALARNAPEPDAAEKCLRRAVEHFQQAVHLGADTQQMPAWVARHHLGCLYYDLRRYDQAIAELSVAYRLADRKAISGLLLAQAYLRAHFYSEADFHFAEIAALCDGWRAEGAPVSSVELVRGGLALTHAEIRAWAEWGRAACRAERGADLRQALAHAAAARTAVCELPAPDRPPNLLAAVSDAEGYALLRLGALGEALRALQQSVDLYPDPEGYLHLALACEALARAPGSAAAAGHWNTEALRRLDVAQRLDKHGEWRDEIESLRARLTGV